MPLPGAKLQSIYKEPNLSSRHYPTQRRQAIVTKPRRFGFKPEFEEVSLPLLYSRAENSMQ
jgi:hypothetical protein